MSGLHDVDHMLIVVADGALQAIDACLLRVVCHVLLDAGIVEVMSTHPRVRNPCAIVERLQTERALGGGARFGFAYIRLVGHFPPTQTTLNETKKN